MTMGDIDGFMRRGIGDHKLVHMRCDFVDCESKLVLAAWEQIKKAVDAIAMGIESAEDHKAEALLLMWLRETYIFHGYTPGGLTK